MWRDASRSAESAAATEDSCVDDAQRFQDLIDAVRGRDGAISHDNIASLLRDAALDPSVMRRDGAPRQRHSFVGYSAVGDDSVRAAGAATMTEDDLASLCALPRRRSQRPVSSRSTNQPEGDSEFMPWAKGPRASVRASMSSPRGVHLVDPPQPPQTGRTSASAVARLGRLHDADLTRELQRQAIRSAASHAYARRSAPRPRLASPRRRHDNGQAEDDAPRTRPLSLTDAVAMLQRRHDAENPPVSLIEYLLEADR